MHLENLSRAPVQTRLLAIDDRFLFIFFFFRSLYYKKHTLRLNNSTKVSQTWLSDKYLFNIRAD